MLSSAPVITAHAASLSALPAPSSQLVCLTGSTLPVCSPAAVVVHLQAGSFGRAARIVDREDDYRKRRLNRVISPPRNDAFAMGDKTPDSRSQTYADVMREAQLARERDNTLQNIAVQQKQQAEEFAVVDKLGPTKAQQGMLSQSAAPQQQPQQQEQLLPAAAGQKRRNRWDQAVENEK